MQATGNDWVSRLQQGIQQATDLADRFGVDGPLREQAASMFASRVGASQEALDAITQGAGRPGSTERLTAIAGQAADPSGKHAATEGQGGQPGEASGADGGKLNLNSIKDIATTAASIASANPKVKAAMWALQQVDLDKVKDTLSVGQKQGAGEGSQNPEAARELLTQAATDPQAREDVLAQMRDNPEFRRAFMHETGGVMNTAGPRMKRAADQSGAVNMADQPGEGSDQGRGPKLR